MKKLRQNPPVEHSLPGFDMQALCSALDEARRARNLSWGELTTGINEPFKGKSSIPINVSTIRGMQTKRSVTSAVVLQVLRWLDRAPESFLAGRDGASAANERLPDPGPSRILRFDTRSLHAALDAERMKRGLKWKQVADELPGFTESMLANLATGPLIGFPRVMLITQWLRRPAVDFVSGRER